MLALWAQVGAARLRAVGLRAIGLRAIGLRAAIELGLGFGWAFGSPLLASRVARNGSRENRAHEQQNHLDANLRSEGLCNGWRNRFRHYVWSNIGKHRQSYLRQSQLRQS